MNWNWVYAGLALLAVCGIWDCRIILGNIQKLLFQRHQLEEKRREADRVLGPNSGFL